MKLKNWLHDKEFTGQAMQQSNKKNQNSQGDSDGDIQTSFHNMFLQVLSALAHRVKQTHNSLDQIKLYFPLSHSIDRKVISGIIHVLRNGLQ